MVNFKNIALALILTLGTTSCDSITPGDPEYDIRHPNHDFSKRKTVWGEGGLSLWGGGESEEKVADAVTEALKIGYRMFDCAECYGNEKVLGTAFKNYFDDDENSVQRSDICIVSKVWNTNHKAEHVREAFSWRRRQAWRSRAAP